MMTQKMPMSEPDQASDSGLRAIGLFDQAAAAHGLPAHARRLLALAASYQFLARQAGADHSDRGGRGLALDAPIAGLSADEQAIVASVAAFQREKLRPNREPAFLRLGERDQH